MPFVSNGIQDRGDGESLTDPSGSSGLPGEGDGARESDVLRHDDRNYGSGVRDTSEPSSKYSCEPR